MGLLLWGTGGIPGPMHDLGERISSEEWLGIGEARELPGWKAEV